MTRDQLHSVQDDIAFMRNLANEGRHAPLLAGPILVAAAIIFGIANVGQWAILTGLAGVSASASIWLWIASGVVFAIVLTWLISRMKRKPGVGSTGNRAVGAAWSGVGFGIFATWLALMAIGLKSGNWDIMQVMPVIVLVGYGSAWMIAGAMTGVRWMKLISLACYAGAIVAGYFSDSLSLFLVFAVLLVLIALVPGLILMRQEPQEVA